MKTYSILVVDDDQLSRKLLSEYLSTCNCVIDVANNGYAAADLMNAKVYDVAFLDCSMPGMSGLELTKAIKAKNPKTVCVMVSGYELIDENFAKMAGVDIFLCKPIALKSIADIIAKIKEE